MSRSIALLIMKRANRPERRGPGDEKITDSDFLGIRRYAAALANRFRFAAKPGKPMADYGERK